MIAHIFNSGIVSGPEMLVLPALSEFTEPQCVIFLVETRLGEKGLAPARFARNLGIRVHQVEVHSRFDFSALKKLQEVLKEISPRIVHAHDAKATTYAWLSSRGSRWKKISTHHGVLGRPDRKTKLYELFYSHLVLRFQDLTLAVSRPDFSLLLRRGIPASKLIYVANGISFTSGASEKIATLRAAARESWRAKDSKITPSTLFVGMAGRLSKEKRHEYFLFTLASLDRSYPELDWRLLVFGSGILERSLKELALRLGLQDKIHWFGYVENLPELLPGLDILALPSSAEGLPVAALEAGLAAVPLFASAVGDLPDLVAAGAEAGGACVAPTSTPEEAAAILAAFTTDRQALRAQGENLRNRVAKNYSRAAWVKRMTEVYSRV